MSAVADTDFCTLIQNEPCWFMEEVLGVKYLTPQQKRVTMSVRDKRRTAAPSGHGVGKTWLAARLVLWHLYAFPGCIVVTTAPTWFQVENLLWREIHQAYAMARFPLGGDLKKTELNLGDKWYAVGLSTNEATRFQGMHARKMFLVLDEATGVAPPIWDAGEALMLSPQDRFLAIGNPTDPSSRFKRECDSGRWEVIRLSADEHPNVTGDEVVIPGAVTKEWIAERIEEYGGPDSPLARARIFGRWPEAGDDVLISIRWVEEAEVLWRACVPNHAIGPQGPLLALGCDVARSNTGDETVVFGIHQGPVLLQPTKRDIRIARQVQAVVGQDTMATAGTLMREGFLKGLKRIGVDDDGVGGGVTDRLRELKHRPLPIKNGGKPLDPKHFTNQKTEMWWWLREMLRTGQLALPPENPRLQADLTIITVKPNSKGLLQLEKKEDLKKPERLGRSPDRGDALAMAVYAMNRRSGDVQSW